MPSSAEPACKAPQVVRPPASGTGHHLELGVSRLMPISALRAESFFGSLKNEWYSRFTFKTRAEARMSVIWYIESFYNRMRPHSSVGWRKPAELMEDFFARFDTGCKEVKKAA